MRKQSFDQPRQVGSPNPVSYLLLSRYHHQSDDLAATRADELFSMGKTRQDVPWVLYQPQIPLVEAGMKTENCQRIGWTAYSQFYILIH